jgi:hypothetical protein
MCCEIACDEFQTAGSDIVIDGYFVEVEVASSSLLVQCTLLLLGLPERLSEEEILTALSLQSSVRCTICQECTQENDGFATLRFADAALCTAFVQHRQSVIINDISVSIRRYTEDGSRVVHLAVPGHFHNLRTVPRFQDLVLHVPGNDIPLSSKVLAMSSHVVSEGRPLIKSIALEFDGDYDGIINALYGIPLSITTDNCHFIHRVMSVLKIDDLMTAAGSICYETLDLWNCLEVGKDFLENKWGFGLLCEFVSVRALDPIVPISGDFPIQVFSRLVKHPTFAQLRVLDFEIIFRNNMSAEKVKTNEVAFARNPALNIEMNREWLIRKLVAREDQAVTEGRDDVEQNVQRLRAPERENREKTEDEEAAVRRRRILDLWGLQII